MPARASKKQTPIESAGRAVVQWAVDQAAMRDFTRRRQSMEEGETVFYLHLPRLTVEKERTN